MTHPLKTWLKERKLSVKKFCEDADFSYVTVYKLLKGEGEFSTSTLKSIAAKTGGEITLSDLVSAMPIEGPAA